MSMDMPTKTVIELPEFDTGQYEGFEFRMSHGDAKLTLLVSELPTINMEFSRIRWHQFTALPNCSVEMIQTAYFRLVEITDSVALKLFIGGDRSTLRAYNELHHYRIFLDDSGCHEIFAEVARLET